MTDRTAKFYADMRDVGKGVQENFKGWVPYPISVPLSKETSILGFVDAGVHVIIWIIVFILESATLVMNWEHEDEVWNNFTLANTTKYFPKNAAEASPILTLQIISLAVLIIAFLGVLVVLLLHLCTPGVEDGGLMPFITTAISGGIKSSAYLTLLIVGTAMFVYLSENTTMGFGINDLPKQRHHQVAVYTLLRHEENFFIWASILAVLKLYGLSFTLNNLRFSIKDGKTEHH